MNRLEIDLNKHQAVIVTDDHPDGIRILAKSTKARFTLAMLAVVLKRHLADGCCNFIPVGEIQPTLMELVEYYGLSWGIGDTSIVNNLRMTWRRGIGFRGHAFASNMRETDEMSALRTSIENSFMVSSSSALKNLKIRFACDALGIAVSSKGITINGMTAMTRRTGKPKVATSPVASQRRGNKDCVSIPCGKTGTGQVAEQGSNGLVSREDPPYAATVEAFRGFYLDAIPGNIGFGGRAKELRLLDEWLNDAAGPAGFLLSGAPGYGKSSLLVHWSELLKSRPGISIIFFPVSIRMGTNRELMFLQYLASALSMACGSVSTPLTSPEALRDVILGSISKLQAARKKVVIVIDGIDEAADWTIGPWLTSVITPPNIRLLVSARCVADKTVDNWLVQIG